MFKRHWKGTVMWTVSSSRHWDFEWFFFPLTCYLYITTMMMYYFQISKGENRYFKKYGKV